MPKTYTNRVNAAKNRRSEMANIMLEQDVSEISSGELVIKIDKKSLRGEDIQIDVTVLRKGEKIELPEGALPLVYANPPFMVGTGRVETIEVEGQEFQVETAEENPKKALEQMVERTIKSIIKKWQL